MLRSKTPSVLGLVIMIAATRSSRWVAMSATSTVPSAALLTVTTSSPASAAEAGVAAAGLWRGRPGAGTGGARGGGPGRGGGGARGGEPAAGTPGGGDRGWPGGFARQLEHQRLGAGPGGLDRPRVLATHGGNAIAAGAHAGS